MSRLSSAAAASDCDGGPLPPGWTLTGLPAPMIEAFRHRAAGLISSRFLPMLRHRRHLRQKRASAHAKVRASHKDIANALRGTGSPFLVNDAVVEAVIEHGTLSNHVPGEIVCYAGETCSPSMWFLLSGRLDSFPASVSWHSPNLSEGHFLPFESMSRKSYVYRPVQTAAAAAAAAAAHHQHSHSSHHHHHHAVSGSSAGNKDDPLSSTTTSSTSKQPSHGGKQTSFSPANAAAVAAAAAAGASSATAASSAAAIVPPAIAGDTRYSCTQKGGLSRTLHTHGRRGATDVRAPRALADLATIAGYHFTHFYCVPYDLGASAGPDDSAGGSVLVLRLSKARVREIFLRLLTHEQREDLMQRTLDLREAEMLSALPLHPLQINESWLFRGIGQDVLRQLAGRKAGSAAAAFPLLAGQVVAPRGRRLAHILFVQRGLLALLDEKGDTKTILGPGSVYGEREALFRERLTVSVVALSNADVLALSLRIVKHTCQTASMTSTMAATTTSSNSGGGGALGSIAGDGDNMLSDGSSSSLLMATMTAPQILNYNAAQRRQSDLHASFEASGGKLAESVRRTPLIPQHLAHTLLPLLKPRVFSAGAHIVDSTAECDRIVYLTRGCAVVRGLRDDNGGEVLFQRGESIGFTCLVSHRWERTIIAAEPVDTWELSREDLHRWVRKHTATSNYPGYKHLDSNSSDRVPDLYAKILGAAMQLLQPFYISEFPRDPALEGYVMNPALHYGEDLGVVKRRDHGAHGFVQLGGGAAAVSHGGGAVSSSAGVGLAPVAHLRKRSAVLSSAGTHGESVVRDVGQDEQPAANDPGGDRRKSVTNNNNNSSTTNMFDEDMVASLSDRALISVPGGNRHSITSSNGHLQHQLDYSQQQQQQQQHSLLPRRNTLPWLDTPNLHPTSFEVGVPRFRPWIPPYDAEREAARKERLRRTRKNNNQTAVSSSPSPSTARASGAVKDDDDEESRKRAQLLQQQPAANRGVALRGILPNWDYMHQFDSSSSSSGDSSASDNDNDTAPAAPGKLKDSYFRMMQAKSHNVYERWKREALELLREDANRKKRRPLGQQQGAAAADSPGGGGGGGGGEEGENDNNSNSLGNAAASSSSSTPHRRSSSNSKKPGKRPHSRDARANVFSSAAGGGGRKGNGRKGNDGGAASGQQPRPPMGTFTPGAGNYGDHETDTFGSLTSHTYTFSPATQFERSASFQRRMILLRKQRQMQSHHGRFAASSAGAASDGDEQAKKLHQQQQRILEEDRGDAAVFGLHDVVREEDFVSLLDPGRVVARVHWSLVKEHAHDVLKLATGRSVSGSGGGGHNSGGGGGGASTSPASRLEIAERKEHALRALAGLTSLVRAAISSSSDGAASPAVSATPTTSHHHRHQQQPTGSFRRGSLAVGAHDSPSVSALKMHDSARVAGSGGAPLSPTAKGPPTAVDRVVSSHQIRVDKTDENIAKMEKDVPALKQIVARSRHVRVKRRDSNSDDLQAIMHKIKKEAAAASAASVFQRLHANTASKRFRSAMSPSSSPSAQFLAMPGGNSSSFGEFFHRRHRLSAASMSTSDTSRGRMSSDQSTATVQKRYCPHPPSAFASASARHEEEGANQIIIPPRAIRTRDGATTAAHPITAESNMNTSSIKKKRAGFSPESSFSFLSSDDDDDFGSNNGTSLGKQRQQRFSLPSSSEEDDEKKKTKLQKPPQQQQQQQRTEEDVILDEAERRERRAIRAKELEKEDEERRRLEEQRLKEEHIVRARHSRAERQALLQEKIQRHREEKMKHWMGHSRVLDEQRYLQQYYDYVEDEHDPAAHEQQQHQDGERSPVSSAPSESHVNNNSFAAREIVAVEINQSARHRRMCTSQRGLTPAEVEREWGRHQLECLSGHAVSASEISGSLLMNWRASTERAAEREREKQRQEQRSILLQPRKPYQPNAASAEIIAQRVQHRGPKSLVEDEGEFLLS